MTFLEKLNKFPPILCRFVARTKNGRRGLTAIEISNASGLPLRKVYDLSRLRSWDEVEMKEAQMFASGCGVDLLHLRRHKFHLRHHRKIHAVDQFEYLKSLLTCATDSVE